MENTQNHNSMLLRVFLTGYSPSKISEESFSETLKSHFPEITIVNFPGNKEFWQGFAFADFSKKEDFHNFLKLKNIRLEEFSMNLVIKPHKTGKALKRYLKDVKKRKIEVEKLPDFWEEKNLEDEFSKYGKIENCYIERINGDSHKKFKGVVFFKNRKSATEVRAKGYLRIEGGRTLVIITQKDGGMIESQNQNARVDRKDTNFNNNPSVMRNFTPERRAENSNLSIKINSAKFSLQKRVRYSSKIDFSSPRHLLQFHQGKPYSQKYFDRRRLIQAFYEQNKAENLRINVRMKRNLPMYYYERIEFWKGELR